MSERAENEAWRQVTLRQASPTWRLWAAGIDRAHCLTTLGREVLHWAADRIAGFLGPAWLAEAVAHGRCPLTTHETWPTFSMPHVYAYVLDLALRLDLIGETRGVHELRSLTEPHGHWERWRHFLAQVRIGSGAVLAGWDVEFEPMLAGRKSADVRMTDGSTTFDIEIAHLRLPDAFLEADKLMGTVRERILAIEDRLGVHITATVTAAPPADVNKWLRDIEEGARQVAEGHGTTSIRGGQGLEAVVDSLAPRDQTTKFSMPIRHLNVVQRLLRTISKKSEQVGESDAAWIVVEDGSGLWQQEWWRDLPNHERLDLFCSLIGQVELSPAVRGVALTHTARHMGQRDFGQALGGAAHLGRALPTGRFRETLIRTKGTPHGLATMYSLHDDEATFLETAVRRVLAEDLNSCFTKDNNQVPQA